MSVHSLPSKRPSSDGAGTRPASAARSRRPRGPRRRVLIRRPWVRAIEEPGASDRDLTCAVIVRGETLARDRRAA
jgi:hypothetical protein